MEWFTAITQMSNDKFLILACLLFTLLMINSDQILRRIGAKKRKLLEEQQTDKPCDITGCDKGKELADLRMEMQGLKQDLNELEAKVEAEAKISSERHAEVSKQIERVHMRMDDIYRLLVEGRH